MSEEPGDTGLVEVFRTADPMLLAIVRSALEVAGVRHVVQGGAGPGLFPLGPHAIGLRQNLVEARILVEPEDGEQARAIASGAEPIAED